MERPRMLVEGFHARIPLLPHEMTSRLTPVDDMIVLCHLGVPALNPETWTLQIDGLVERPLRFRYDDLRRRPQATVVSVHQCAGSPLTPEAPTRRVTNVAWTGVRLRQLLDECGPMKQAQFAWTYGCDFGSFHAVAVDAYLKDMPLSRIDDDVLIALDLNGKSLPAENGFPARLVVPGFYGTNSVKWLKRITIADRRADSPFTTRWYNDPVVDADGNPTGTAPVWRIAPESIIVAPLPGATVEAGKDYLIWGWAWADGGVSDVQLSCDDGETWMRATLEDVSGRAWQRFEFKWTPQAGDVRLTSRARACDGLIQPPKGARNAMHVVPVHVR